MAPEEKDLVAPVSHSASVNNKPPQLERCCDCGSERVTNHKFWHGDLLPMCQRCFAGYMR